MAINKSIKKKIETLSTSELEELDRIIKKKIGSRKKAEALAAITAIAEDAGLNLAELISADTKSDGGSRETKKEPKTVRKKVYVNPYNQELVWSGRGRHPIWFKDIIRSGVSPESLVVELVDED